MYRIYTEYGVKVIELSGNVQQAEVDNLEDLLQSIYDEETRNVIIDMKNVTNMCSSALGLFVSFKQIFSERKGDLKIVTESPAIHELLKVTMLDKVFDTTDGLEDALSAFQR